MTFTIKSITLTLCISFISFFGLSEGIEFKSLSLKSGLDKAKNENKMVFIDVYATWCGPCKYLSANVFTDEELGSYMNAHFVSLKLDGEKGDGLELMEKFELDAYPTMLFLNPDGSLIKKIVGAVEANEILSTSMGIVDPESTPLAKLTKQFESGDRSQEFLQEFLIEKISNEDDIEELAADYFKRFPELTLEDENDFIIFYMASDDLENAMVKDFLENPATYIAVNEDLASQKYEAIIIDVVRKAKNARNEDEIRNAIDLLFPAYELFYTEEPYTKEEFEAVLIAAYEGE